MDKEVRELVQEAGRQGWRCELRKGGHWLCFAPDGVGRVSIASTPSDHRWRANTIAKMRRHGFRWPPPKE
ncbi:MAG TPA: hypothetical protein VGR85_15630 [Candidatus Limnocylindria bacterium]|jgi:hypothetical protein|nr:hypothetical protein [Candidatus Limnocylindria bacterium]